jgi:hypothetical protein
MITLILTLTLANCTTPEPELVKSLRFEPPLFDSFKQNTKLKFELIKPATLDIYITNREGKTIKTIATSISLTQGTQTFGWKGDTDEGYFAPVGIYIGVVNVKNNKTYKTTVEIFHW